VTLRPALAVALAVALTVLVIGCGSETGTQEAGTDASPSLVATDTSTSEVSADPVDTVPQATSPQVKTLDPSGVGTELDAMAKELDLLDMPSDADFSEAEGALY
jgi:PBP1b-binding outer membrane lipoprotein LpoB